MPDNGSDYTIKMSTEVELNYEDGFADGYSRGWQECWEYFRTIFANDNKPQEQDVKGGEGE